MGSRGNAADKMTSAWVSERFAPKKILPFCLLIVLMASATAKGNQNAQEKSLRNILMQFHQKRQDTEASPTFETVNYWPDRFAFLSSPVDKRWGGHRFVKKI